MNKLKNLLEELDFTSPNASVFINKKTRFRNPFGGVLTILLFFVIFTISIYGLVKLIRRDNLMVIYNEEFLEKPFLNITNFPIFFEIYDPTGKPFADPDKIFTISTKRYSILKSIINGTYVPNLSVSKIDVHRCDKLMNNTNSYYNKIPLLSNYDIKGKLCLDLTDKDLYLLGNFGDSMDQSFFSIDINKCQNSTANNYSCYSEGIINTNLGKPTFLLRFLDYYINNNLITEPQTEYIKGDAFSFTSQTMKVVYYNFINVDYTTDFGLMFNDERVIKFSRFIETAIDTSIIAPGYPGILKVVFTMQRKKAIYLRNFEKLQTVIASLSAIAKILMFIFSFINRFFNEYFYFNFIANSINLYENSKRLINNGIINIKNKENIQLRKSLIFKHSTIANKKDVNNISQNLNFNNRINKHTKNSNFDKKKYKNIFKVDDNKIADFSSVNNLVPKNYFVNNKISLNNKIIPNTQKYDENEPNINNKKNFNLNENISKKSKGIFQEKVLIINEKLNESKEGNDYAPSILNNFNINMNNKSEFNNENISNLIDIKKSSYLSQINDYNPHINTSKYHFINMLKNNNKPLGFLNENLYKNSKNAGHATSNMKGKFNLTLKWYHVLCRKLFQKPNDITNHIDISTKYIEKKLSVEEIIRKLQEIDKLKFLKMTEEELNDFGYLQGPNLFIQDENIKKVPAKLESKYKNNYILSKEILDNFWSKFEFET